MESLRSFGQATYSFGRSVVEWRSPASGPYLMIVNSIFWALAVYGDEVAQVRALGTVAAGVIGWDVLLSPSNDRSTIMHLLAWPLASFWRTSGVVLSIFAVHQLKAVEVNVACIAAYSSVGCLLVNPVWQYHHTNERIARALITAWTKTKAVVDWLIVQPSLKVFYAVKYVVLLEFLPPLIAYIGGKLGEFRDGIYARCRAIRDWWRGWIMLPIREKFLSFGRFLRYWFCAEWWPAVKQWSLQLFDKVRDRCTRIFNYICYGVVYVVCGYWVKPLARFVWGHLTVLGAYLHRTLWTPAKTWVAGQLRVLADLSVRLAKATALAIRDSILWPVGILLCELLYHLAALTYRVAVQPLVDILYDKYKVVEDFTLINVLGPAAQKFVDNIPEKNPLCDDSDVELEGFLPEEISEEAEQELDGQADSAMEDDDFIPHDSPLDHEESEFAAGLDFPAVDASESSDEEFDLARGKAKTFTRRRPRGSGDRKDEGAEEGEGEERRQRRGDDNFELLQ